MDLLEYQGKQLFARAGVAVPEGEAATDVEGAVAAAERIGFPCVIKAQVLIGGRGKAGGHQGRQGRRGGPHPRRRDPRHGHPRPARRGPVPGPRGLDRGRVGDRRRVLRLDHPRPLREEGARDPLPDGRHERRGDRREATPTRSSSATSTRATGLSVDDARGLAVDAGIDDDVVDGVAEILVALHGAFTESDATLIEVNPLIVTAEPRGRRPRRQGDDRQLRAVPPRGARRPRGPLRRRSRRSGWRRSGASPT